MLDASIIAAAMVTAGLLGSSAIITNKLANTPTVQLRPPREGLRVDSVTLMITRSNTEPDVVLLDDNSESDQENAPVPLRLPQIEGKKRLPWTGVRRFSAWGR